MQGPVLIEIGSLGRGTSGQVLLAKLQTSLGDCPEGTEVAQKRALSPAAVRSLEQEQLVLSQVQSRTLQVSLGLFRDPDGPYLLTRYIHGPSLHELKTRGPLDDLGLRRVGQDLAQALAALHSAGWLHGDLAPANARQDPEGRTILLDLGFAERTDTQSSPRGTPAYLAPEEAHGAPKTPGSEVYSLGLILWELATANHPLSPDGHAQSVSREALASAVPWAPSMRNARLAPDLDELLGQMLDEDPAARPTSQAVADWLANPPAPNTWGDDPWAARDRLPFIGHQKEWMQLQQAWESASAGQGQLVWLQAERGLGKTRLMDEFVRSVRRSERPATYLSVRCAPALEGRPTHPIRLLLRRWLALDPHTPAGKREWDLLAAHTNPHVAADLAQTLDPKRDSPPQVEVTLLTDWLVRSAQQGPMVVLVDELELAGEATLTVAARLIEALPTLPLLLVLGVRSSARKRSPAIVSLGERAQSAIQVNLAPLNQEDMKELVDQMFAGTVAADRLARALSERTLGRPARLDALFKRALDLDLMRIHPGGGLELVAAAEDLPHMEGRIPDLQARLTSMPPKLRVWLEKIAVDGLIARPERLSSDANSEEVSQAIESLLQEDWLELGPEGPAFPSGTVRDGILEAIPAEQRRQLHAAAAAALAQETGAGRAFERAFHLKAAGLWEDLLQLVLELVPTAQAMGHPARVLVLVDWALESIAHIKGDGDSRQTTGDSISVQQALVLHGAAADAAGGLGRRPIESKHLNALVELPFDSEKHPAEMARVFLLHGHAAADTGRAGLARGYLRNAARLGRKGKQPDLAAEALRRWAEIELATGNPEQARDLARKSRSKAHSPLVGLTAQLIKGSIALLEDRPTRARAHAQAVLKQSKDSEHSAIRTEVRARAWILEARCASAMGDPEAAQPRLRRALEAAAQVGQRSLEAEARARLGRVLIDLGQTQAAEQELREGQLLAQEIRMGQGEVLARLFLGTLLMDQDRRQGADLIQLGLQRARDLGLVRAEALAGAIWARVLRAMDRPQEAAVAAETALKGLERVGAELCDRIVIVSTHRLICDPNIERAHTKAHAKKMSRRITRACREVPRGPEAERMKARFESLERAALSPDGPLYPRRGRGDHGQAQ